MRYLGWFDSGKRRPPRGSRKTQDCRGSGESQGGRALYWPRVRILALDVGAVRIGAALSDDTETLASPLATLRASGPRQDAQRVAALAREHAAGELVVGLPLRLDGSLGPQAERVLDFVARLRRVLRLPVTTRDERLTSIAAAERLADAGVRRRLRKERLDRVAAVLILQEYLDERKAAFALGPRADGAA